MKKILLLLAMVVVMFAYTGCGTVVPSGHRGVYFNFMNGTDTSKSLGEGFHILAPWNSIYVYDIRLHEVKQRMKILAADQLNLSVDVSLQYRLVPDKVQVLHVQLGSNYEATALIPALRNVVREVVTSYKSTEAYLKRAEIQHKISQKFKEKLKKYDFFIIENVLVRNIDFPKVVEDAINKKLAEKQEAERMQFVLEKERKEAERKKIEAEGIAEFQRIVTQGINENLLRWKAIETTLKLAESKNAKIVIIGSGKDGLPIILGD